MSETDAQLIQMARAMNPGTGIRQAVSADAADYVQLMNRYYSRKKSEAYFCWQFLDAPHPSTLFVAEQDHRILGFFGVHILKLTSGEKAAFTVDLLVEEDSRNRGLGLLLSDAVRDFAAEQDAVLMAALPNETGLAAHLSMPGWQHAGDIKSLTLRGGVREQEVVHPQRSSAAALGFERTTAFNVWRYDANPLHTYEYIEDPCGYIVYKIFHDPDGGGAIGDIVDYRVPANQPGLDLLRNAAGALHDRGVSKITTWALPHLADFALMKALGFIEEERPRHFAVAVLDTDFQHAYELQSWRLVQSDSEVY